jgi:hypothetical protein
LNHRSAPFSAKTTLPVDTESLVDLGISAVRGGRIPMMEILKVSSLVVLSVVAVAIGMSGCSDLRTQTNFWSIEELLNSYGGKLGDVASIRSRDDQCDLRIAVSPDGGQMVVVRCEFELPRADQIYYVFNADFSTLGTMWTYFGQDPRMFGLFEKEVAFSKFLRGLARSDTLAVNVMGMTSGDTYLERPIIFPIAGGARALKRIGAEF